jgi:hypothetical protein
MATPRVSRPSAWVLAPRPTAISTIAASTRGRPGLLLDLDRTPSAHAPLDLTPTRTSSSAGKARQSFEISSSSMGGGAECLTIVTDAVGGNTSANSTPTAPAPITTTTAEALGGAPVGADDPGLVDRHAWRLWRRARREHDGAASSVGVPSAA